MGGIGVLGEVYDRDGEESETLRVRRGWARMLGLEEVERLGQVLAALKMVSRVSGEDAAVRLEVVLEGLPAGSREVYRRFVGTLMASGSDQGTEAVSNPPREARSIGAVKMPGAREQHLHFFNLTKLPGDARVSTVCHGRRLFVCRTACSPGYNFGLCPAQTQDGDRVALFVGSDVLHVIRPLDVSDGETIYGLVGEAYVHNWMGGQLLEEMHVPGSPGLQLANIKLR